MQDYLNETEESFSTNFSISTLKNNLWPTKGDLKVEENIKDYPIRCPTCYTIPQFYFNLNGNNFCTLCDKKHKFMYTSFEDLIENCDKKLSSVLCHQCKNESDLMYICPDNT